MGATEARRIRRRKAREKMEMDALVKRAWDKALVTRRPGESYAMLMKRMVDAMNSRGASDVMRQLPYGYRPGERLLRTGG